MSKKKVDHLPRLTREEILLLKEAFQAFDRDGDGKISIREFQDGMQTLGHSVTEEEVKTMIERADLNKDGLLDFREFVVFTADKLHRKRTNMERDIQEVFQVFDQNRDGFITADELREALGVLGENITIKTAEDMIQELDIDGDGRLSYREFVSFLIQTSEEVPQPKARTKSASAVSQAGTSQSQGSPSSPKRNISQASTPSSSSTTPSTSDNKKTDADKELKKQKRRDKKKKKQEKDSDTTEPSSAGPGRAAKEGE